MIRTFYDKGQDYIDSFWPLVIKFINSSFVSSIGDIQTKIKKEYDLDIPQHSLSIILTRAKGKDYVTQDEKLYKLTEQGVEFLKKLESESEVNERITKLIKSAKEYLEKKYKKQFTDDNIINLFGGFVEEHINYFEQFVNKNDAGQQLTNNILADLKKYEIGLLEYLEEVYRNNPNISKTVQDIVCGSIISSVLSSKNLSETTKKFETTIIYFDTNIILSLLEFRYDEENKPVKELFELMLKEKRFKFKVFDFTIIEIINVLKNYFNEQYLYSPDIKVASLYSSLKSKGWSPSKVRTFVMEINEHLYAKGIDVENTNIKIDEYEPKHSDKSNLIKYKPEQGSFGQNHDLAAIDRIIDIREKTIRRLEYAKALFLTSDVKLSKYDFKEMGHDAKETICEVMLDRLLTNVLWLKNPSILKDIPLSSIIAMHSKHLFINESIWKHFYEIIRLLKNKNEINEEEISILIYDSQVQNNLRTIDLDKIDTINKEWLMENIKEAKKKYDLSQQQLITNHEKDKKKSIREEEDKLKNLSLFFTQKISKIDQENNNKWYDALAKIKEDANSSAKKSAKIVCSIIFAILLIVLFPVIIENWQQLGLITTLITIISILVFGLNLLDLRQKAYDCIYDFLYKKIYRSKIKIIEKIEQELFNQAV